MKIAFVHSEKKISTGAHFINDLIGDKLRQRGVQVQNFYPRFLLTDTPIHFKGLNNILFFYSLLERREEVLRCDIIQGTTYTPLAFIPFNRPIVSHFGSTTINFLRSVPKTNLLGKSGADIFYRLQKEGAISELNVKTRRPFNDIATIEQYAAERVDYLIAASAIVRQDLLGLGIPSEKVTTIHNAIEDYWYEPTKVSSTIESALVFLGRLGEDPFTLKLKGLDRLVYLFQQFPKVPKLSVVMSRNKRLVAWLRTNISNHQVVANALKDTIPPLLQRYAGGIVVLPSRYEGFSLSLDEAMSQRLVPVTFPVGVAPEIIKDGYNGFLVKSLDQATEKIKLLLHRRSLRHRLAVNAHETAKQLSANVLIDKTLDLYQRIVTDPKWQHRGNKNHHR